jgi:hypothetical protein
MKSLWFLLLLAAEMVAFGQDSEHASGNEANRSNLSYSLTTGIGARTDSFGEFTVAASYILQPRSVLTFSVMSLDGTVHEKSNRTVDGSDLYYVGITTQKKGSAFALSYKQFFTDSFYVEGGLDHASVEGEFRISKDVLASTESLSVDLGRYTKISALVQIGHQWQWKSFTLGTSWLGFLQPLSSSEAYTDATFFGSTPNSVKKFRDEAKQSQTTVLRFYLGWGF